MPRGAYPGGSICNWSRSRSRRCWRGTGRGIGSARGTEIMSKTRATGRIEVRTYEPTPYEEPTDAPQLVELRVSERFAGDIEGEGVTRFLQAVRPDGSASFVGTERVTGTIHGRPGSFLLQDAGRLQD